MRHLKLSNIINKSARCPQLSESKVGALHILYCMVSRISLNLDFFSNDYHNPVLKLTIPLLFYWTMFHCAPVKTFCSSKYSLLSLSHVILIIIPRPYLEWTLLMWSHPSSKSSSFTLTRKSFPFILTHKDMFLCLCQQNKHLDLYCNSF